MKSDDRVLKFVDQTLRHYGRAFGLRVRRVRPMPEKLSAESVYGQCFSSGTIYITIRWPKPDGRAVLAYALVDTMAHELAHLRHPDHGSCWFRLYALIFYAMADDGVFDKLSKLVKRRP